MVPISPMQLKEFFLSQCVYLNDEEAEVLASCAETPVFEPGENLIEAEKYEPYLFYITDGCVRGFKNIEDFEEHTIFLTEPTQTFLSPEKLLSKEKKLNKITFKAITKVHSICFKHDELLDLAMKYPGIFEFYNDMIVQIVSSLYERIQLLLIASAEDRYLHLEKTRPLVVKNTHKKHLAQYLGITPNSFSRLIRIIRKEDQN